MLSINALHVRVAIWGRLFVAFERCELVDIRRGEVAIERVCECGAYIDNKPQQVVWGRFSGSAGAEANSGPPGLSQLPIALVVHIVLLGEDLLDLGLHRE